MNLIENWALLYRYTKLREINCQLNSLKRKFGTRFHQMLETLLSLNLEKSLQLIFLKIYYMISYH